MKIYVCSKINHAPLWQYFRDSENYPIISRWIDIENVDDYQDLWKKCFDDIDSADVVAVYSNGEDHLQFKGCLIEIGYALALNKPIVSIGLENFTIVHDKDVFNTEYNNFLSSYDQQQLLLDRAIEKGLEYGKLYNCVEDFSSSNPDYSN